MKAERWQQKQQQRNYASTSRLLGARSVVTARSHVEEEHTAMYRNDIGAILSWPGN